MLIQSTNPVTVAPDSWTRCGAGFCARTCSSAVHEQFMTETAQLADVVLPATMFLEHDDVYQGGGHTLHPDRRQADRAARRVPLEP